MWGTAAVVLLAIGGTSAWFLTRPTATAATQTREVQASLTTLTSSVSTTGTIEPAQRLDLSFASAGEVTAVHVAVGDKVSPGTALASMDSTELQADVDAAAADADAAYDDYTDAKSSGTTAAITAARSADTVKQKALADAKEALAAATLTSTIDGTVAAVNIAVGDTTGSSQGGATGGAAGATTTTTSSTAAIVVISTGTYAVETSVGSADRALIAKGMQAEIVPTSGGDTLYGTVSAVGVMAESSSTTTTTTTSFPVTIKVTGTTEKLYAGASATVTIIYSKRADVLTVPTAAITSDANGQTVVTLRADGHDTTTVVKTGSASGNVTEITSGLAEGDTVVVTSRSVAASGSTSSSQTSGLGGLTGTGGFPAGGQAPPGGQMPAGTGQRTGNR